MRQTEAFWFFTSKPVNLQQKYSRWNSQLPVLPTSLSLLSLDQAGLPEGVHESNGWSARTRYTTLLPLPTEFTEGRPQQGYRVTKADLARLGSQVRSLVLWVGCEVAVAELFFLRQSLKYFQSKQGRKHLR